jgi:hypothetical protein
MNLDWNFLIIMDLISHKKIHSVSIDFFARSNYFMHIISCHFKEFIWSC